MDLALFPKATTCITTLEKSFQIGKNILQSDEKVYIDIRRRKGYTSELERVNRDDSDLSDTVDLKVAATKKMRLYIRGYYQTEYMYMLSKHGLTMQLKEYSVAKIKN